MDKERLKFHTALVKKIKEWEGTENFAAGSSNRQKLNRSLNLLLGTNPDVLVDFFDINTVPNDPREAMNLIRGADLKTLKDMEIFQLSGLGKKLVLHHQVAANTLGIHLSHMSPKERLNVYKGMIDLGQKHGMDPRQLILIPDSIHKSIAHEGDFSGKKTGVLLPPILNESGDDFLKRFKGSIDIQLNAAGKALNEPVTKDWYKIINKVEDNLGIPKGTFIGFETPLELKAAGSKFLNPSAEGMRQVFEAGGDLELGAQQVINTTKFSEKSFEQLNAIAQEKGFAKLNPDMFNFKASILPGAEEAVDTIKKNPMGAAIGASSFIQPEAVTSALQGDYTEAAIQTGVGAGVGAVVQQTIKRAAPAVMSLVPKGGAMVLGTAGRLLTGPVGAAYTGLELIDAAAKGITGKGMFEPSGRPVTEEDLQFSTL
jgi:hypothetical protein